MNIYLLTRPDGADYDEYESAVVIASDEPSARAMHPSGEMSEHGWVTPDKVGVALIGQALSRETQRVVCAKFNAG